MQICLGSDTQLNQQFRRGTTNLRCVKAEANSTATRRRVTFSRQIIMLSKFKKELTHQQN